MVVVSFVITIHMYYVANYLFVAPSNDLPTYKFYLPSFLDNYPG